ncbi:MAG: hypothetical protein QF907_03670 [Nitrospinota bacterium]|mgnify:FL=1|nr:hypothetical protein [Nitrospinota bacterium]
MQINISKKQINELESLAELQFSAEECATILEIDPGEFTREMESNAVLKVTYQRGRLKADAAVRKAILEQAKQGSTPAQKQMIELINHAKRPEGYQSKDKQKDEWEL